MTQIRYAWLIEQDPVKGNSRTLITPSLYRDADMRGRLICIECKKPISRSPRLGMTDTWERQAFFKHSKAGDSEDCALTQLSAPQGIEKESTGVTTVNWLAYRTQTPPVVDKPLIIDKEGEEEGGESHAD